MSLSHLVVGTSLPVVLLLTSSAMACAVEPPLVDDLVSCPTCGIRDVEVATFLPQDDRFSFTTFPPVSLARDRSGHFIAGPVTGEAVLAVFTPEGGVAGLFGAKGQGPGEFTGPPAPLFLAVGDGDTIHAVDPVDHYVLGPQASGHPSRTRMSVHATDAIVTGGRLLVRSYVLTSGGGTSIQILRDNGTVERSVDEPQPRTPFPPSFLLAPAWGNPGVWVAHPTRYEVNHFALDGVQTVRLERRTEWFRPYDPPDATPGAPFLAPADPRVVGLVQDRQGLVWVAIARAPSQFRPPEQPAARGEVQLDPFSDMNQLYRTTIEVLDPVAGKVVTRRDFEAYVRFVRDAVGETLAYWMEPLPDGDLGIKVVRLGVDGL